MEKAPEATSRENTQLLFSAQLPHKALLMVTLLTPKSSGPESTGVLLGEDGCSW